MVKSPQTGGSVFFGFDPSVVAYTHTPLSSLRFPKAVYFHWLSLTYNICQWSVPVGQAAAVGINRMFVLSNGGVQAPSRLFLACVIGRRTGLPLSPFSFCSIDFSLKPFIHLSLFIFSTLGRSAFDCSLLTLGRVVARRVTRTDISGLGPGRPQAPVAPDKKCSLLSRGTQHAWSLGSKSRNASVMSYHTLS